MQALRTTSKEIRTGGEPCDCWHVPSVEGPLVPLALFVCQEQVEVRLRDGGVVRGQIRSVDGYRVGAATTQSLFLTMDDDRLIEAKQIASMQAVPADDAVRRVADAVATLLGPTWPKPPDLLDRKSQLTARVPVTDHDFAQITIDMHPRCCEPSPPFRY